MTKKLKITFSNEFFDNVTRFREFLQQFNNAENPYYRIEWTEKTISKEPEKAVFEVNIFGDNMNDELVLAFVLGSKWSIFNGN